MKRTSRRDRTEALRAKREALRGRLRKRRGGKGPPEKKRRRWWLWLLVLLLILLLLLRNCSCTEPPPDVAEGAAPAGGAAAQVAEELPAPAPLTGRVERQDRPAFATPPPGPLPWVASFRLQVAARSPRLADCFVGAQRPGTLKWTASMEPMEGTVSDHDLEPTLLSDPLTRDQRECLISVLSEPRYQLQIGDERSTPSRVGMVIEF